VEVTAVYVVRTTVAAGHDEAWLRWQDEEHIGNLLALPGYLGVQRFAEVGVAHRYLNIWRLADRSAMGTADYRAASLTPWFERIRPHYDVEVDFSEEASADGPWRDGVRGLVVDRAAEAEVEAGQAALGAAYEQALGGGDHVVQVVRLRRLASRAAADRSSPSDVLLTYLRCPPQDAAPLPAGPPVVERRSYSPLTAYLTSSP
jgi:hypothetical protein